MRKILTFVKRSIVSKIFGKITLEPGGFRKASSSPRMTEQIQINFIGLLRMHLQKV